MKIKSQLCKMEGKNEIPIPHTFGDYSIVWKYIIKPESRDRFEYEYGRSGSWYRLFSESKDYSGSFLHQSEEEKDTYLLVDIWTDQQSYEDFKTIHAHRYNQLSSQFETLYQSEERIGAFSRIA
jgi:hypothetical protein